MRVDQEANQQRLYDILLGKAQLEQKPRAVAERTAPNGGPADAAATTNVAGSAGEGARDDTGGSAAATVPGAAAGTESSPKGKPSVSYADELTSGPQDEEHAREREKAEYVAKVCSDSTRLDVRDWVGRIFTMVREAQDNTEEEPPDNAKNRRRRAWNSSSSESSGTTLVAAGGSIAATTATKRTAPSLISAESLVVNPPKPEPLSTEERLRAYLRDEIPELASHVHAHVAAKSEVLRREVDEELVEQHLMQMRKRAVFDGKTNFLRWQASRRVALQKRLDDAMPDWIGEAVASWNQRKAMKAREEEVSETDLIFDYLTKRAAHINTNKLASEIPVFKTLHASYSLPAMWRDKYLQ